jgi:hypothetical protein
MRCSREEFDINERCIQGEVVPIFGGRCRALTHNGYAFQTCQPSRATKFRVLPLSGRGGLAAGVDSEHLWTGVEVSWD